MRSKKGAREGHVSGALVTKTTYFCSSTAPITDSSVGVENAVLIVVAREAKKEAMGSVLRAVGGEKVPRHKLGYLKSEVDR